MSQPFQWGTVEAAQQIRTGRISAREYLRALLERIERVDPALQAWARLAGDRAAAEAARCDEEAARGSDNLMPKIVAACEAFATVGEISDRLRNVFGEYREG